MPPENESAESPLERIERHIREMKAVPEFFTETIVEHRSEDFKDISYSDGIVRIGSWAELSEAQKLGKLTLLDWQGLPPLERLSVIEAEVDLTRVSPAIQRLYLGEVHEQALQAIHGGQVPSLTAAILADPQHFLDAGQAPQQNGHDPAPAKAGDRGHEHGRGR